MDQRSGDDNAGAGHDSIGVMKGTVVVFAEPRVFESVRLGERVPKEKEKMAKSLAGLEGEVGAFKRRCGDSGGEGHDCN